jgi:hypothetical protein
VAIPVLEFVSTLEIRLKVHINTLKVFFFKENGHLFANVKIVEVNVNKTLYRALTRWGYTNTVRTLLYMIHTVHGYCISIKI